MLKVGYLIYHGLNTWCPIRKRDVPPGSLPDTYTAH
jgi:hypothetical protein